MALEPDFSNIDDLVPANPADNDPVNEGDDHLRGIKEALKGNVAGSAVYSALLVAGAIAVRAASKVLQLIPDDLLAANVIAFRDNANTLDRARIQSEATGALTIANDIADQDVALQQTFTVEGLVDMLRAAGASGEVEILVKGESVLKAHADGISSQATAGDNAVLDLLDAAGVVRGSLALAAGTPEQAVVLYATGEDNALYPVFAATAIAVGGRAIMYANQLPAIESTSKGANFLRDPLETETRVNFKDDIDGNTDAQITVDDSNGFVLTAVPTTMSATVRSGLSGRAQLANGGTIKLYVESSVVENSQGFVLDGSGLARPIGFNVLPGRSVLAGQATIVFTDNGGRVRTGPGAAGFTINESSLPDEGVCIIQNTSGGPLTIAANAPVSLQWMSGAGVIVGNRTMQDGAWCTLHKRGTGSNVYDIIGNGLS